MSGNGWHLREFPPDSKIEHRIIIVYKHENTVQYFYVTSKIANARKAAIFDPGSIADRLSPNDWDALTEISCVQCNKRHLYSTSEEDLRQLYKNEKLEVLGKLPDNIKRKIIAAICASESFSEAEKRMYTVD